MGLFSEKSDWEHIANSLEEKGYNVTYRSYRSTDLDYDFHYEYVVSHSAGTVQAQLYADQNPESHVYILAPVGDFGGDNVRSVGQNYDPVSFLVDTDVDVGGWVHDKDAMYDAIADEIPDAE